MDKRAIVVRGELVLLLGGKCSPPDLLIEDGRIGAIDAPGISVSEVTGVVSAPDRLLIPGLISSHTHSHGALNRGTVDDKVSLEMFLSGGASGSVFCRMHPGSEAIRVRARLAATTAICSTSRKLNG